MNNTVILKMWLAGVLAWTFSLSVMVLPARAGDPGFGELAPGALSISEQSGVRAEICRDHLIDPSHAKGKLPPGYRLLGAHELAKDDPQLAALVASSPNLANHVMGSLCFMLVGRFEIDGVSAIPKNEPSPMAFWWARAERTGEADPRMQGKSEWVQLASWYSDVGTDRALIRKTDPMAEFVRIDIAEPKPGTWNARLVLAGESVEASVEVSGEPQKRKSREPGFMTVPSSGSSAGYFTVFTYFGHHHQNAKGDWKGAGNGALASAFRIAGESGAFGTFFQSRWQARAALYEVAR